MHVFHDRQIDQDHDQLIILLDALSRLTPCDGEVRARMVRDLLAYVSDHGRREEAIMAAAGYPERAAHAQAHRALHRNLARLSRPLLEAGPGKALCLARRLCLAHLLAWDEAFGAWLAQRELDHVS